MTDVSTPPNRARPVASFSLLTRRARFQLRLPIQDRAPRSAGREEWVDFGHHGKRIPRRHHITIPRRVRPPIDLDLRCLSRGPDRIPEPQRALLPGHEIAERPAGG